MQTDQRRKSFLMQQVEHVKRRCYSNKAEFVTHLFYYLQTLLDCMHTQLFVRFDRDHDIDIIVNPTCYYPLKLQALLFLIHLVILKCIYLLACAADLLARASLQKRS